MIVLVTGCGNDSTSGGESTDVSSEVTETTPSEIDYDSAVTCIKQAIESINMAASVQQKWLDDSGNLPYLYDDANPEGGNYGDARMAGKKCFDCRKSANEKMAEAKEMIKGGTGEYHDAVEEYYLAADADLKFVSNFPEGYSKVTWNQKWTELSSACEAVASKIELKK